MPVAVANRGLKRICPSCGTRYYDFNKRPVICPSCETQFTGEVKVKSRRGRPVAADDDEAVLGDEGIETKEVAANDDDVELPENEDTVSLDDVEEGDDADDIDEDAIDMDDVEDDDLDDDLDDDDDDDEDDDDEDEED